MIMIPVTTMIMILVTTMVMILVTIMIMSPNVILVACVPMELQDLGKLSLRRKPDWTGWLLKGGGGVCSRFLSQQR